MIYIASPYTHAEADVMQDRFAAVCMYASHLMQSGLLAFSPIAHSHPIAVRGGLPRSFEFWDEFDRSILSICDAVHVLTLDGWRESTGIASEVVIADLLGLPVEYVDPERYAL